MSDATQAILSRANHALIGNYARLPVVMERGEGSYLWDTDGRRFIDLFAGFGGGILGHCHPDLVRAVQEQSARLWHVGNTFHSLPQTELAERLVKTAFPGKAFFCHSGLEANEAACKLARLRGNPHGKWKIISMHRSFHGRSLAMIAATGNPATRVGFDPVVPGFTQVDFGDMEGLVGAVDDQTAGIIVEPIQGEGGVYPMSPEYAAELRKLCDEKQITLIFDEVWTGCGRTGTWFGHQNLKRADGSVITPDIMTLGKAVGGGLPMGVMYARPDVAAILGPGKHGCTLGGNPICCAASRTIFDVIERDGLLGNARTLGEHAVARLKNEPSLKGKITQIRGKGLFIGVELKDEPVGVVEKGIENGVLINLTAKKVVRLAPPMNIDIDTWNDGLDRVVKTLAAV
jgi:predicted acetylornithine/succinylornithine family transaminase